MRKRTTSSAAEKPSPAPGSSYSSPVPVGTTIKTTIERGDPYMAPEIYALEITILEIVRGQEAWERIKTQGVSNKLPKPGYEYVLARIKFGYFQRTRGRGDKTYQLPESQLVAVSADGKREYEIPPVLQQPQPQLIDWVFHPGESHDGWVALQVPVNDKKPRLIFKREHTESVYGIWRYVWFQLY